MKVIDYLFHKGKLLIYLLLGLSFSLLTSWIIHQYYLLSSWIISFLLFLLIRCIDDYFDYQKDIGRKNQYLSQKELLIFFSFLSCLLVGINLYYYQLAGLLSIILVGYILVEEFYSFLQPLIILLIGEYLVIMNGSMSQCLQARNYIFCITTILLSIIFGIYKRRKSS